MKLEEKNNINDYFTTISEKELDDMIIKLSQNSDDKSNYFLLNIKSEKKFRFLCKYFNEKISRFLVSEYIELIENISDEEIKESISYFSQINISIENIIMWCPMLLSVYKSYNIYQYLQEKMINNVDISNLLISDNKNAFNIYKNIDKNCLKGDYYHDGRFLEFLESLARRIESKKVGTESYSKYVKKILNENEEVIRKLV